VRRIAVVVAVAALAACNEPAPAASAPEPPLPRCVRDADCVAVEVQCAGTGAFHRSVAAAQREEWEQRAAIRDCVPRRRASPYRLAAYCQGGGCVLDEIAWPELRGCAQSSECAVIDDPCVGPLGVRADREAEARALVASDERTSQCADSAAARPRARPLPGASDRSPPVASCVRGYCRL